MMKKIKRSISILTLRAFSKDTSDGGLRVRKEGWFFQKRQESTLIQSDPSVDDGFNIAAFYVEGQLDFPNQVPENVLQLYHELYDMEQKVKALENEIAVYVMSFQNNSRPATRKGVAPRRKPINAPKQCCIPRLLGCPFTPIPVISETNQRKRPFSRPVTARMTNKRNSVSAAVQTTNSDNRGSRLSKVSWNSKVDVRYIGSNIHGENAQKMPLQGAHQQEKTKEELKNVVHLKIKIPKDVLNLTNQVSGQEFKRLENEWNQFNSTVEKMKEGKNTAITNCTKPDTLESVCPAQGQDVGSQNCTGTSCLNGTPTESSQPMKSNLDTSNTGHIKLRTFRENESNTGNAIVGTSVVHNRKDESTQSVGIPVKQPGKRVCDSQGCSCKGSTRNDRNLDKVRQSFDMTESELSMLEKTVHNNPPMELKIRTEYGSVNVTSHDPDCKCKICETFGSHNNSERKHRGRSDEAAVISKKIIRIFYNGDYRNIITHTEECGCEICSNIEEHSYKLTSQRASILSTHRGDLVVKNRGVCGCENCKTVEMGPHVVDVETMLSSRSSFHVLDKCYYSDATIPSMQSFPREGLTTTDDQAASFSSPPSINSSDLSDNLDSQSPSTSNVNKTDHQVVDTRPGRNLTEIRVADDVEPAKETRKGGCSKCDNNGYTRVPRKARKRMLEFVKPSSAKSSPAGLDKRGKDEGYQRCPSCKYGVGKNIQDKPVKIKSRFPNRKNLTQQVPLERVSIIDDRGIIQSNNDEVPRKDQKADTKVSTYNADHTTLEELIRDLVRGQPGIKKDKVYTVTLGEVSNKACTKIHIVDCSSKSGEVPRNENKCQMKEPVKMPNGDSSNSNVFFIKPLPSSTDESHRHSELPSFGDSPNSNSNSASANNRSLSSPACLEDVVNSHSSAHLASLQALINTSSEGIQEFRSNARSASDTCPRSDMPKRAFRLTISFGKKVASFFRQRGKKKPTLLAEHEASRDNLKCLKTFTICEGAGKQFKHMELLQIDVKPRYFTLQTASGGEEANGRFKQSPILCLLEKNSDTQIVATLAR